MKRRNFLTRLVLAALALPVVIKALRDKNAIRSECFVPINKNHGEIARVIRNRAERDVLFLEDGAMIYYVPNKEVQVCLNRKWNKFLKT